MKCKSKKLQEIVIKNLTRADKVRIYDNALRLLKDCGYSKEEAWLAACVSYLCSKELMK